MIKKDRNEKLQRYFIHKTKGPVQILMEYSVHPVPTGSPWEETKRNAGPWYKYQTQDDSGDYGMCQDSDLGKRIKMDDAWAPQWKKNYKESTGENKY